MSHPPYGVYDEKIDEGGRYDARTESEFQASQTWHECGQKPARSR